MDKKYRSYSEQLEDERSYGFRESLSSTRQKIKVRHLGFLEKAQDMAKRWRASNAGNTTVITRYSHENENPTHFAYYEQHHAADVALHARRKGLTHRQAAVDLAHKASQHEAWHPGTDYTGFVGGRNLATEVIHKHVRSMHNR